MAILSLDALSVTSFDTTASTGTQPVTDSNNCGSPLCMTDDPVCTTPWCPPQTEPQPAGTIAG